MNKYRKLIEITSISLILLVFFIIGHYTYQSYLDKKDTNEEEVKLDNYYNIDFLFNNNYVSVANTISDFSDEDGSIYMYLDTSNTFYIKNKDKTNLSQKIKGLPSDETTIYYNHLNDNNYEFIAKTNKDEIYYVNIDIEKKYNKISFSKVGNNIADIYMPTYDKNGVYINKNNKITTNFIILDKEQNLKYIDYERNYVLKNDLISKKPYFDYTCLQNICDSTIVYSTFNNEISYNNQILTDQEENKIYITDFFTVFSVPSKQNIDINTIDENSIKKYDYILSIYAIDIDGTIYKLDIDNKTKTNLEVKKYSSNKVKHIEYKDNEELQIVYDNDKIEKITAGNNKKVIMSTIYEKSHLKA